MSSAFEAQTEGELYRRSDTGKAVFVKGASQQFYPSERLHQNPTGIQPTEFKVLIEPKAVEEVTKGGIIIPDATKTSEQYAQTEGRIIARSPLAFSYATEAEWEANKARKPDAGDLVLYAKYAGVRVKGRDGKEYLLINDKDVTATVEE